MEATETKPETPLYVERTTCRACGGGNLSTVLNLGEQELPRFPESKDEVIPKAPLELVQCEGCGLLQLRHTVDPDMVFRTYYYRSSVNQSMRDALKDVVDSALVFANRGTWLDIGANDGCLLSYVPANFGKIACEPARDFTEGLKEHADHVIPDYFSAKAVWEQCDVITSAAMFYDLDDPNEFIADIASTLSPDGVWVNQLNDSPTMLKRNAFDSIVHEHLCYYDLATLSTMYARHGLSIRAVTYNEVNGGSVRVFAQHRKTTRPACQDDFPSVSDEDAKAFALRVGRWRDQMQDIVDSDLMRYRPLWGYGASTKLGILLGYLQRNKAFIGIADRNAAKWGKQMGGTGIRIVKESQLRVAKPGYVLVGPWAFKDEFVKRERQILDGGTTMIFPLPNIEFVV